MKTFIRPVALTVLLANACAIATDIAVNERKSVQVAPPARGDIALPQKFHGMKTVPWKDGKEYRVNLEKAYRDGYEYGWKDCLEQFAQGRFDLEEDSDPDRELISAIPDGVAFYPGADAARRACREALRARAKAEGLTFVPARPPWQKRLEKSGGFVEFNQKGRPTTVWWPWHSKTSAAVTDDMLQIFHEMPVEDIEHIQIDHTSISDAGLATLPPMPKLAELWISPPLTSASFATLARFPKLHNLQAVGLHIAAADVAALAELRELEWLDLSAAEVGDEAIPYFARVPKLKYLILTRSWNGVSGPGFTPEGVARFAECRTLKRLSLDGSVMDDRVVEAWSRGLSEFQDLGLQGSKITDASLAMIGAFTQLEELRLDGTAITVQGLAHLANHPTLKALWLAKTAIGDDAIPILAKMPKLESVWLGGTRVTKSGVSRLKAAKPQIGIDLSDH